LDLSYSYKALRVNEKGICPFILMNCLFIYELH
jgi:hypothetical protein